MVGQAERVIGLESEQLSQFLTPYEGAVSIRHAPGKILNVPLRLVFVRVFAVFRHPPIFRVFLPSVHTSG